MIIRYRNRPVGVDVKGSRILMGSRRYNIHVLSLAVSAQARRVPAAAFLPLSCFCLTHPHCVTARAARLTCAFEIFFILVTIFSFLFFFFFLRTFQLMLNDVANRCDRSDTRAQVDRRRLRQDARQPMFVFFELNVYSLENIKPGFIFQCWCWNSRMRVLYRVT